MAFVEFFEIGGANEGRRLFALAMATVPRQWENLRDPDGKLWQVVRVTHALGCGSSPDAIAAALFTGREPASAVTEERIEIRLAAVAVAP